MSYAKITCARELTDSELTMVSGGSLLNALETAGAWVGGIIGYLAAGAPGAAAGSIAGAAWVDGVAASAPVQGQISSQIGFMPSQSYF